MREQVEAQLAPLLGEHERDGLLTTFWTRFPGGTLRTDFDLGGRGRKLTYRHMVYDHEGENDARSAQLHHWDISTCAILYRAELERNLEVCPKCTHHMRINARTRLELVGAGRNDVGTFDR